jgi:hypothetical protein
MRNPLFKRYKEVNTCTIINLRFELNILTKELRQIFKKSNDLSLA